MSSSAGGPSSAFKTDALYSLADATTDLIVLVDQEGVLVYANPAALVELPRVDGHLILGATLEEGGPWWVVQRSTRSSSVVRLLLW